MSQTFTIAVEKPSAEHAKIVSAYIKAKGWTATVPFKGLWLVSCSEEKPSRQKHVWLDLKQHLALLPSKGVFVSAIAPVTDDGSGTSWKELRQYSAKQMAEITEMLGDVNMTVYGMNSPPLDPITVAEMKVPQTPPALCPHCGKDTAPKSAGRKLADERVVRCGNGIKIHGKPDIELAPHAGADTMPDLLAHLQNNYASLIDEVRDKAFDEASKIALRSMHGGLVAHFIRSQMTRQGQP